MSERPCPRTGDTFTGLNFDAGNQLPQNQGNTAPFSNTIADAGVYPWPYHNAPPQPTIGIDWQSNYQGVFAEYPFNFNLQPAAYAGQGQVRPPSYEAGRSEGSSPASIPDAPNSLTQHSMPASQWTRPPTGLTTTLNNIHEGGHFVQGSSRDVGNQHSIDQGAAWPAFMAESDDWRRETESLYVEDDAELSQEERDARLFKISWEAWGGGGH